MPKRKQGAVVAVLNMKGGVGKTILSANVFREVFSLYHVPTLLVDFDAQFNLTQLLLTRADYDQAKTENRTIFHVLEPPEPDSVFAVSESDMVDTGDPSSYIQRLESHPEAPDASLDLLAGDFRLARMNIREQPALRIPRKRFQNFIEKARDSYQIVVLDCNPSSSFVTRCAIECATHLLIPVRPDKFSVMGVEILFEFLDQMPTARPMLNSSILVNDESPQSDLEALATLRAHAQFGPKMLVKRIKHSAFFQAKTDYTGFATDRGVSNRHNIAALLREVAADVATTMNLT